MKLRSSADAGEGDAADQETEDGPADQMPDRKRARAASSLDFRADNKSLVSPLLRDDQKPPKQQQQEQPRPRRPPTRSRGSGGIPRKYNFVDLEGMDEQQLLQALYEDPELAAMAAAAAAKGENGRRVRDEHPEYLQSMMDEGIPVKQWIILLLLLGIGIYQLRKSLTGPKGGSKTAPGAKKTAKQKAKKINVDKAPRKLAKVKEKLKVTSPIEEDIIASVEVPAAAPKETEKPNRQAKKKKARKKDKAAKPQPTIAVENEKPNQTPDSVSTDDSSTADLVNETEAANRNVAQHAVLTSLQDVKEDEADADQDGWQTVGADRGAAAVAKSAATKNGKGQSGGETDQNAGKAGKGQGTVENDKVTSAPASVNEEVQTGESDRVSEEAAPAPSEKDVGNGEVPTKASQEDQPASTTDTADQAQAAVTEKLSDTVDDEALALQLQKEEDAFAESTAPPEEEDTWKPVEKKKKGKLDAL